jgi:hypothetical protein
MVGTTLQPIMSLKVHSLITIDTSIICSQLPGPPVAARRGPTVAGRVPDDNEGGLERVLGVVGIAEVSPTDAQDYRHLSLLQRL